MSEGATTAWPIRVEDLTDEQRDELCHLLPDRPYDTLNGLLRRVRGEVNFNGQPITREAYDALRDR